MFKDSYDNKLRGLQANRDIAISSSEKVIANEREGLKSTIERLKAEIIAAENSLLGLDSKLKDKTAVINLIMKQTKQNLTEKSEMQVHMPINK